MAGASFAPSSRLYRRRHPENTPLHCLLEHFRSFYRERYQAFYGPYRRIISSTVASYLRCGILRYGFARLKCPNCQRELLLPFSCKCRYFCPSCHAKRVATMGREIQDNLITPVAHVHLVLTIPRRLRYFFRKNRSLLGKLSRLAYQCIGEVLREVSPDKEATPGAIIPVHTAGNLLNFHFHLHALVSLGVFSPDGSFLGVPRILSELLTRVFGPRVLGMLKEEGKIDERTIGQIEGWKHSGFSVDASLRLKTGEREGFLRVLHYLLRPPFALKRMKVTGEKIIYRADKVHPRLEANFRIYAQFFFSKLPVNHLILGSRRL